MTIEPGTVLEARTASGTTVMMRAISRPLKGRDFPVVWVCTEEEYRRAQAHGELPAPENGIPWPMNAVRVPEHA